MINFYFHSTDGATPTLTESMPLGIFYNYDNACIVIEENEEKAREKYCSLLENNMMPF